MAGSLSKRKRGTAEEPSTSTNPTINTHITATIPLRSRASASVEPRSLTVDQAVQLGALEHEQQQSPPVQNPTQTDENEQQQISSDDDEAPEAISTSASRAHLRATEAAQHKAIKEAESRSKTKRKERQHRLDEQAKERAAKRQRQELEAQQAEHTATADENEDSEEAESNGDVDIDMHDGDLLPASLLAEISDERPPTPPPEATDSRKPLKNQNARLVKRGVLTLPSREAPRDLQLDAMSVSVLTKRNERLPPRKGRSKENSVIGNWMRGRHSIAGAIKVKRKGVKVRSGRVTRKPFGLKTGFS